MTEILKPLKYINKITSVDNLICITNGVFHGVFRTVQHEQQRYHEGRIGSAVVFENLNSECSGTADTALMLATVFGNSADFWLNLQQRNELWKALNTPKRRARIEKAKPIAA